MMIQEYFEERNRYLNGRNTTINSGVPQFLNILKKKLSLARVQFVLSLLAL